MFEVKNKVAVITGGTGVLGSSIAKGLLESGAKVIIINTRIEVLKKKLEELKQYGEVSGYICDVLSEESLRNVRSEIENKYGGIDILVNAAGGNTPGGTISEDKTIFDISIDEYNKVVNLNSNGTVYPCLIFGESMARNGSGSIVNISSMATYSAITRVPGYSVAKTGMNIFTQWLAMELAMKFGDKIRVNAIAPGFFIGDQNRAVLINHDGSLTERSKKVIAKTPMRRFGKIDELNGIVQFLCSDAASFITGAIIPVDGGFSAFSGV
ncbi:MAG: SDR family oxidoreductase [Paludibacter sp.]|nr:SDR family oxidoreductase [Paludibacter sp.]